MSVNILLSHFCLCPVTHEQSSLGDKDGISMSLVKVKVKSLSSLRLVVTPWTAAYQALPSMGFARQKYWSGMPLLNSTPKAGLVIDTVECPYPINGD